MRSTYSTKHSHQFSSSNWLHLILFFFCMRIMKGKKSLYSHVTHDQDVQFQMGFQMGHGSINVVFTAKCCRLMSYTKVQIHTYFSHDALFLSLKGLEYYTHDATTFAIYCYGSFIFFKTRKLRSLYVVSAYKNPASTLSQNSSFVLDRRK